MNLTCCPNCGAWHNPEDKTPPAAGHVVTVREDFTQRAEALPPQRYYVRGQLDSRQGDEYAVTEVDADPQGEWVKWEDIASQYMNKTLP